MPTIDFKEVFNKIKDNFEEYLKLPVVHGSIIQNEPSLINKKDGDKWVEKIYNLAYGILYISVKMYNVMYSIEMGNNSNEIKDFHLSIYEDDNSTSSKISIGAKAKYKKQVDAYGEYDKRYLFIRYISNKCNIDIDDVSVDEEVLIDFLNMIGDNSQATLFRKMIYK